MPVTDYIKAGTTGLILTSSNPLLNRRVQDFDFKKLVDAFDAARASNATLAHWSVMNSLLDTHLSGADDAALGGDLAYQYGRNGNLANVGVDGGLDAMAPLAYHRTISF